MVRLLAAVLFLLCFTGNIAQAQWMMRSGYKYWGAYRYWGPYGRMGGYYNGGDYYWRGFRPWRYRNYY